MEGYENYEKVGDREWTVTSGEKGNKTGTRLTKIRNIEKLWGNNEVTTKWQVIDIGTRVQTG